MISEAQINSFTRWEKAILSYIDFSTNSTINTINVYSAPQGYYIKTVFGRNIQSFNGVGIVSYGIAIGKTGSPTFFQNLTSVISGITGSVNITTTNSFVNFATSTNITATAICSGGTLNGATQGEYIIYIEIAKLP